MTPEALERRAHELAADWPLPAEDWAAIIDQAARILDTVATLDELPLDTVEPAVVYRLAPDTPPPSGSRE